MVKLAGHKAYLDSNTVIYALEGFAKYANLKAGLLDPLDSGALTAVTSELTLVETVVGPRKEDRPGDETMFQDFLSPCQNFKIVPISVSVLEKVIDLRAKHGIKIPDAIHLATGIIACCTVFFTRDAAWSKAGVTVVDPTEIDG